MGFFIVQVSPSRVYEYVSIVSVYDSFLLDFFIIDCNVSYSVK